MRWINSRRLSTLIASALLAMTLPACESSSGLGNLSVEITRGCERLRPKKAFPEIKETGDYRSLSAEALIALKSAYRKGDRYAACVMRVIDNYGKGGV